MDYRDPRTISLPTTDDEFERLCLLIARNRYGVEYYRYGIKGQKQHGVDIYSAYYNGRYLQCKLHKKNISDAKLILELKKDLEKVKLNFDDLKHFIFAISLETRPVIQDICKELSNNNLRVTPWFWNQMQEEIAHSKWLLRYYLNSIPGAQWISDDFLNEELKRGQGERFQPINFYSGNSFAQWYGILNNWDAPRQHYKGICQAITSSYTDKYGDMPVAAIVRGDGGTGKSVLLRRIAVDLRDNYTVYWIADNAEDFLQNEWVYDIENNPNEKYLLVLEDWYRNFSKPDDRVTANKLIQKVKNKQNVRLLIGDRFSTQVYYPKSKHFDLRNTENDSLLSHIIFQIPEWKYRLSEEQKSRILKTGLFQLLFVYQHADSSEVSPRSINYFLEIIQSDYNELIQNGNTFYRGIAHALYIYANLYADYSIMLSSEAIVILAEFYSETKRPFGLKQNAEELRNDPIVKRYLDIISSSKGDRYISYTKFLHDTLADEGWKHIEVDCRMKFGFADSIIEIIEALKREGSKEDLSTLFSIVVDIAPSLLSKENVISICDFLIENRTYSSNYIKTMFLNPILELGIEQRVNYIYQINSFSKNNEGLWHYITKWLQKAVSNKKQLTILNKLVELGNFCPSVMAHYYDLLSDNELESRIKTDFTINNLSNSTLHNALSRFWKRLKGNPNIKSTIFAFLQTEGYELSGCPLGCLSAFREEPIVHFTAEKYLNSIDPWRKINTFSLCLKICKDKPIAKQKAREFLQSPYFSYHDDSLSSCLKLIKEESLAKEIAHEFFKLSDAYKTSNNFTTCLQVINEEPLAKEKAREYLSFPDAKKIPANFSICLLIIGEEASDILKDILSSSIDIENPRLIYRALQIASENKSLDKFAENMILRIFKDRLKRYDIRNKSKFHLYSQIMKIPFFHVGVWRNEVDKLLANYKTINRNLFYSLTLSHINDPKVLKEPCLYFIRNWRNEFSRPKKYWGYFIRSLAHPIIQEHLPLQKEIRSLSEEMLNADEYPLVLNKWLISISEENIFPIWKLV